MKHYTELELIEDHYLPDPEVAAHAGVCEACRERRIRTARTLDESRDEFDRRVSAKPEGFWSAQREAIVRRTRESRSRVLNRREILRWAFAATFVILLGSGIYLESIFDRDPNRSGAVATATASNELPVVISLPSADPWASEELWGWEEAVAWESWIEPAESLEGTS